jgi:hypothetical protein
VFEIVNLKEIAVSNMLICLASCSEERPKYRGHGGHEERDLRGAGGAGETRGIQVRPQGLSTCGS